ncbi:tRNA pseudouridine synthase [Thiobacillus denitrificans ATCC 25259]|uniref:tRNA pseudouridine synthase A n=2 Tax=Thiobacillus denitrificans TaxID=36861 RepID=TRUA_THIDA|nr:RecName: Full=tRNA pseudouridine synthase A; AltName: Full=tRNA pseudouridine(38-40) synthase; AltName: Full=tRNA pseudouridylate synthase I; AltName: Full=tRNA-uridine isomerase I [Thiobacillus denitrificans ATCC 25259]AAZ97869.1 tRNA pseudouridine synthase [Thiobacillus denitrificans ATCC 25259]
MMRIAVGLEYRGVGFCGWQSQPQACGVQDAVEKAVSAIAGEAITVTAAGRTDTGVHAALQIVHFDTTSVRPLTAWVRGVNSHLPAGVAVLWAREVDAEFHARFAAFERGYRYVLLNHPVRPGLNAGLVGWHHRPLDVACMNRAASPLIGRHDFSAFRAAECQARSPVKELRRALIERRGDYLLCDFRADGFLHHMVRNLMGCLVQIGAGGRPPEWLHEVLAGRDRTRAAPTFEAAGLYLTHIRYPARFALPESSERWPFA